MITARAGFLVNPVPRPRPRPEVAHIGEVGLGRRKGGRQAKL